MMALNAKLVVVGGEVKTAEIKLRLPSTIGRGRGATIMLPHPLVSRQHCELFEANGKLVVRDMGSLNGTFVNNQRITESVIEPGELLTIGAVTFRAAYELSESGPSADGLPGDTNIAGATQVAETPADDIVDVPIEDLDVQETSSVKEPMGGGPRTDTTMEDVVDIEDIEEVDESGSTRMSRGEADLRSTQPGPTAVGKQKGITPAAEEPANDEEEDDLQDFLNSLK
jgi:predicted component of type VI protein secretion system